MKRNSSNDSERITALKEMLRLATIHAPHMKALIRRELEFEYDLRAKDLERARMVAFKKKLIEAAHIPELPEHVIMEENNAIEIDVYDFLDFMKHEKPNTPW